MPGLGEPEPVPGRGRPADRKEIAGPRPHGAGGEGPVRDPLAYRAYASRPRRAIVSGRGRPVATSQPISS